MAKIRDELRLIGQIRARGRDAFVADAVLQAAAERALQVAVEGCLDIGHHVIRREGWERPADFADIFRILRDHDVIEREQADRLASAARFRNRLVHVYANVDPGEVWRAAEEGPTDLEAFLAVIVGRYDLG